MNTFDEPVAEPRQLQRGSRAPPNCASQCRAGPFAQASWKKAQVPGPCEGDPLDVVVTSQTCVRLRLR